MSDIVNPQERHLDSWIDAYLQFTDGSPSPELFRKWVAISTVGAAMERRVWAITAKKPTFANMFVFLVGRPGIGKSEAIVPAYAIIKATREEGISEQAMHLSPTDVTKSSLMDWISQKSIRRYCIDPEHEMLGDLEPKDFNAGYLMISELGNFIREYDGALLNKLHEFFDSNMPIDEIRRYRSDNQIKIARGILSMVAGTTPAYLGRTFPSSAWDEGFISRVLLIYSGEIHLPDLFPEDSTDPLLGRELVEDLRQIGLMRGRMLFTPACKKALVTWQQGGCEPAPSHPRLEHYKTRRLRHVIKLSMIAAANRSSGNFIDVEDFQEALGWLVEAEKTIPQIFMEMVGKSDNQVINELYHFVAGIYHQPLTREQPVRRGLLVNHLRAKVASYQIDSVIKAAVDAELIQEVKIKITTEGRTAYEIRYKPAPKPMLYRKPG